MNMKWIGLVVFGFFLVGCATPDYGRSADIRQELLNSAEAGDPEFPDGEATILTHFSYVGQLRTAKGDVIFVADSRAVTAGMLAPRGRNAIMMFDHEFQYLGKMGYVSSRPLWCNGSKLYLFGEIDGFVTGLSGNVIDVSDGYENLVAYHESAYGSSGGIADERGQSGNRGR